MSRSRWIGETATLRYAGRNRRSVMRRGVPLTNRAHVERMGIVRTGIGSATAAARHVLRSSCTGSPIGYQLLLSMFIVQYLRGGHLCPEKAGQLAGDRGGDHRLAVLCGAPEVVVALLK